MSSLAILFGAIVGLALGLTGGGGGIFAVPLLVFGLSVAPREAVGISLAAVGGTAAVGAITRVLRGQVEFRSGWMFAIAGIAGAPVGAYLATLIPEPLLLVLFAGVMLVVAQRMWAKARSPQLASGVCQSEGEPNEPTVACRRDAAGQLQMNTRCAVVLLAVGVVTGILSGLFGVGGGFVIVPALVLFSNMPIHRAVGTSLMVIVLISLSGLSGHVLQGNTIPVAITLQFLLGGIAGMWLGGQLAKKISGSTLQRIFAIAVVLVALFVLFQSLVS